MRERRTSKMPVMLMSVDRALAFIRNVNIKCGVSSLYTCTGGMLIM